MKTLPACLAVALLSLFSHSASADVVTLTYTYFSPLNPITGDVGGSGFTSSDWSFSFSVDDTSPDTDIDADRGIFDNPVLNAQMRIDSNVYEIPASNFTINTQLLLYDFSGPGDNLNSIAIYFDAGGINFLAGDGAAFPGLFSDHNDISTATDATSTPNTDANQLGNPGEFSLDSLSTVSSGLINVAFSELAVGSTTVTVTSVAIPEPGTVGIIVAVTAFIVVRRRKTTVR